MYCEKGTINIQRADNGFTVTARDPKIDELNAKNSLARDKGDARKPYIEPTKTYVFNDAKAVMAFLEKNMEKALPKVEYASAFEALGGDLD